MLRYLVQVVENLLATGILTALLFASIRRGEERETARKEMRLALWGCAAGACAALILAVLRRTTALVGRGHVNLWVLSFALVFGVLYVLFLWKPSPKIPFMKNRPALSGAVPGYIRALLLAALLFHALPVIFLYPTEFAMVGESVFTTDFLFKLTGFAAGLSAVVLTALALYKTGEAMPGILLRALLSAAMLVNICNQLILIIQFLLARRMIPMIRWLFRLIVAAAEHKAFFLYAFMCIGLLLPLTVFAGSFKPLPACNNPAEHRKFRFLRRLNRRHCLTVVAGFAFSIFLFTFVKSYNEREVVLSPAEPMTLADDEIIIPVSQIEDGHLHRFAFTAEGGTEVRFIVVKKNEAAYGVGLDACDICGATGYYERKDGIICRLCDVVMNKSTIGFRGGCNPVPLAYSMRESSMIIKTADLEKEKKRFQ